MEAELKAFRAQVAHEKAKDTEDTERRIKEAGKAASIVTAADPNPRAVRSSTYAQSFHALRTARPKPPNSIMVTLP